MDYRFQSILEGSQVETLAAGTEHGGMLLSGMLSWACSATFFIQPRPTCLGMTLPTVRVGPPLSVSNEESAPSQSCLQDNLVETILQLKFPDVSSRQPRLAPTAGVSLYRSALIRGLSLPLQENCILVARSTSTWRPTAPSLCPKARQARWSSSWARRTP